MSRPLIDPALGMNLVPERTLVDNSASVTVIVPAHNEQDTVAEVVTDAYHGLAALNAEGEVVVSASACTDNTAHVATDAGAQVVTAPAGKGAAISAGLQQASGDIICLIDGDLRYFGATPLVTLLVDPILRGIADACISDLYWRALYPQLWLHGFFAPVAGPRAAAKGWLNTLVWPACRRPPALARSTPNRLHGRPRVAAALERRGGAYAPRSRRQLGEPATAKA
jgi:glucosyl-3-phosphoglycerate synthase